MDLFRSIVLEFKLFFLLIWFFNYCVVSESIETINKDVVFKNVDRSIDISSQLAKLVHKITIENSGESAIDNFLFTIEPSFKNSVAFIGAKTTTDLKAIEVKVADHNDQRFYRINLKDKLLPAKTVTVQVHVVLTYVLSPYPSSIMQKEKQLILFKGSSYLFTPYRVTKQTTVFLLGTRNIESYSKLPAPISLGEKTVTYGSYSQIQPFTQSEVSIHYENNSPFLSITKLKRAIQVSHWGNIAVEEEINILHTGAKLKGSFSRFEYQREENSGLSSVKSFKTVLPASAVDAYYRDEIGNISTSNMRIHNDHVELDLRPRFPLFGGWKTQYTLGYSVPSYEYLYTTGDNYKLKMRLVDHIFNDMVIDDCKVDIILPEGTTNIKLTTPYPVNRLPDSLHFTYLDTKGRSVVSVSIKNLVEQHIKEFELTYVFPKMLMLQEPLLVVIAFYLLFLLVVIYVRLDFCISKDEASESRLRVSGVCEKLLLHQDKRSQTYSLLDAALLKLKQNKDVNGVLANIKNTNLEYKAETLAITELLAKLKLDAPEISEKVVELQKLDKNLKDLYNQQQSLYLDKWIPNKINRGQFLEADNNLNKKKDDVEDKINNVIKSLQ